MALGKGSGDMSFGMKFIRLLIIIFNIIFFLIGLILLIIGLYVYLNTKLQKFSPLINANTGTSNVTQDQPKQSMSTIRKLGIALMSIGGILMVVALLGFLGSFKVFKIIQIIYAALIGIIILVEVGFIIYFFTTQSKVKKNLLPNLQSTITNGFIGSVSNGSNSSKTNDVTIAWDLIQFNLKCCGASNKTDYNFAKNWNHINPLNTTGPLLMYPLTCCPVDAKTSWKTLDVKTFSSAQTCAVQDKGVYSKGCYPELLSTISAYTKGVAIGSIVVIIIQLLAFIFAIVLVRRKTDYTSIK
ncbi:unnamed protein product [Didymodactylos carnosus]|uniref:Tetraspanin n=1 Tax=Didymodactylos carnosus TaxID=1234261 RepID=A0A814HJS7_9BILA|nr:unnamed protein product [Didymodactylos carnosus]CAF1147261.1 unnamed protein product [Didymodactylos carnosus]CAF3783165.1 unnamed protein product [Didymodactylos carnosus]CAF3950186.1 unnamed protein product [Didymodactylos carnosus]